MDEEKLTDETKTPCGTQHWELGGLDLCDAYLIVVPGYRLRITHLGGGSYYFDTVPATDDTGE